MRGDRAGVGRGAFALRVGDDFASSARGGSNAVVRGSSCRLIGSSAGLVALAGATPAAGRRVSRRLRRVSASALGGPSSATVRAAGSPIRAAVAGAVAEVGGVASCERLVVSTLASAFNRVESTAPDRRRSRGFCFGARIGYQRLDLTVQSQPALVATRCARAPAGTGCKPRRATRGTANRRGPSITGLRTRDHLLVGDLSLGVVGFAQESSRCITSDQQQIEVGSRVPPRVTVGNMHADFDLPAYVPPTPTPTCRAQLIHVTLGRLGFPSRAPWRQDR